MAYYLYKNIRDKHRSGHPAEQQAYTFPLESNRMEAPMSCASTKHNHSLDTSRPSKTGDEKTEGAPSEPSESTEAAHISQKEKQAMRRYRWQIIAGLFLPMLLWSLNKTMIAAALPFIASDFHQFSQLNWIIAAPELTSAAFVPAWGQLADMFGRYPTLQASVLIMIFGSALCAGAPVTSFPMLLAGRGLQGVATSGIMILIKIVLSDKVSLKQNAVNNTVFALVAGVGFGVGPVIGGYLTSVTWRWCFIINIPIGILGLLPTHFVARPVLLGPQNLPGHDGTEQLSSSDSFMRRLWTVDFGGQFLFIFGMGLLVLALTWAGAYYPWADIKVLAPLIIGSVLMVAFLVWEYLLLPGRRLAARYPHQQPMISLKLLWTRNAGILMYINFVTGMAMYAVFYFVDLYFTIVQKFGPAKAGANLLFYLPGLGTGAYLAMFVCNIWPRKTWYPLSFGTIVEALGITILAAALHWGHLPTVYGMLALTGVGTGVRSMPNTLHGVGYYRQHIATIVSLMSLAISLGGTLASTIMLNIFNNKMSSAGINLVRGPSSASSFSSIDQLPRDEQKYLRRHAKDSVVIAFYGISSFMWLGVVAMMFMGNVDIKKDSEGSDTHEDGQTHVENLTKGAYLGSLFRRQKESGRDSAWS